MPRGEQWKAENHERWKKYQREWRRKKYKNDPVHREKERKKARDNYLKTREKKILQMREYRRRKKEENVRARIIGQSLLHLRSESGKIFEERALPVGFGGPGGAWSANDQTGKNSSKSDSPSN